MNGFIFLVVFACKLSVSQCEMTRSRRGFPDMASCRVELAKQAAAVRVRLPVGEKWSIVGYCGIPLGKGERA